MRNNSRVSLPWRSASIRRTQRRGVVDATVENRSVMQTGDCEAQGWLGKHHVGIYLPQDGILEWAVARAWNIRWPSCDVVVLLDFG